MSIQYIARCHTSSVILLRLYRHLGDWAIPVWQSLPTTRRRPRASVCLSVRLVGSFGGVSFKNSTWTSIKNSRSNLATQHYSCLGCHLGGSPLPFVRRSRDEGEASRAAAAVVLRSLLLLLPSPSKLRCCHPLNGPRVGASPTYGSGEALDVRSARALKRSRFSLGPHTNRLYSARKTAATVGSLGRRDCRAGRTAAPSTGRGRASRETIQIKRATKRHWPLTLAPWQPIARRRTRMLRRGSAQGRRRAPSVVDWRPILHYALSLHKFISQLNRSRHRCPCLAGHMHQKLPPHASHQLLKLLVSAASEMVLGPVPSEPLSSRQSNLHIFVNFSVISIRPLPPPSSRPLDNTWPPRLQPQSGKCHVTRTTDGTIAVSVFANDGCWLNACVSVIYRPSSYIVRNRPIDVIVYMMYFIQYEDSESSRNKCS